MDSLQRSNNAVWKNCKWNVRMWHDHQNTCASTSKNQWHHLETNYKNDTWFTWWAWCTWCKHKLTHWHTNNKFKNNRERKSIRGKTNPLGKDGKSLKCSICDSIEHLRADCPKGHGRGKSHLTSERDQSRGTKAPNIQVAICDAQQYPGHWHVQTRTVEEAQPVEQYISEYERSITSYKMS